MNEKKKPAVTDFMLFSVSVIFLVGVLTVFGPCGAKDDGSFMACHWAGHAVAGVAGLIMVLSILMFLIKDSGIRIGLSIAILCAAALSAIIPGFLISLCMMNTMRCHTIMRPAVVICAAITGLLAIVQILVNLRRGLKENAA